VYGDRSVSPLDSSGRREENMERSWFETIQLLGLDVMSAIALAMLVLDGLIDAIAYGAKAVGRRAAPRKVEAKARAVDPTPDAWPPEEWRPSH
jgi:hypothetical protein